MEPLSTVSSTVVPLDRMNVDTDQIIPKQFLKRIERTGFGEFLFYDWRYTDDGSINPDFVLNKTRYRGAKILLTRENFGSGSSREHAPWALREYGFQVIIAPSFADIFYNNCFKNAILPITLDKGAVDELFAKVHSRDDYSLAVDLEKQTVTDTEGWVINFEIDKFKKRALLEGLDDIAHTLQHEDRIIEYEKLMWHERKWAVPKIDS